jgi:hypothetical protein
MMGLMQSMPSGKRKTGELFCIVACDLHERVRICLAQLQRKVSRAARSHTMANQLQADPLAQSACVSACDSRAHAVSLVLLMCVLRVSA